MVQSTARVLAVAIALAGMWPDKAIASRGAGEPTFAGPVIASRLGVVLEDAPAEGSAESKGAVVRLVAPGSGAERAGLLVGDVLVDCDDQAVENALHLPALLHGIPQGGAVHVGVLRQASRLSVTVYLDSGDIFDFLAPFSTTLTREGPYLRFLPQGGAERLGVMMIDVTPQLAEYFGTAGGVLIASVRPWSPAERGGLRAGDVVTRVGANTVRTVNDLAQALHRKLSGARLSIGVTRHREAYSIEVRVLQ